MPRLLLALLLIWSAPATALVRSGALSLDRGRIVLQLAGKVTARQLALGNPQRLVVDLDGVDALTASADGAAGNAIKSAKIGQFDPSTARLVITLGRPMRVATAKVTAAGALELTLAPDPDFAASIKRGRRPLPLATVPATAPSPSDDPKPPAFPKILERPEAVPARQAVAGMTPEDFDLPEGVFGPNPPAITPPPQRPATIPAPAPRPRSGGKPLVVVDAGHGGKDVGAIAFDGEYEKDITLAVARVVARALTASGKVRVKLTRADDRFIPLGGRVAIARAARADLFVSIHADSAPNPLARGASVYTLSDTASDAVAARLAARENKADIIGGVNLGIEAPEVGDVMIALMRRNTLNTAISFAETLQSELDDRIAFRGEFHHFAGFLVLKAADVPSVLLETGYVSNEDDAKLLFSKAGQKTVGEGVARAIEAHFGQRKSDQQYLSAPRD